MLAQESWRHVLPVRAIGHQQDCGLKLCYKLPRLLEHDWVWVKQSMTQAFYNAQSAAASLSRAGAL